MASAEKLARREEKKRLKAERKFTRVEKSWIMYDWANSIYATNIMAAIFPVYFAQVAAGTTGELVYGYAVSIANLLVAILAPMLGAIGDFKGMKKKLFSGFLVVGLLFTIVMAIFDSWQLMLLGLVISRIGFSGSCLFCDSFLTDVTTPDRMDRVSAWAYAMGYIGGSTIPFIISIVIMVLMDMSTLSYKIAILIVVVWWSVFSIPFLRNVKQVHSLDEPPAQLAKQAFRNVAHTFKSICADKRILCFIIAYFFYIDGVDTIISMATNYGSTLGLGTIGMILALLVTQVVAVPFSILFGNLGKKVGGIKMISVAVCVYFLITIIGFYMGFSLEKYSINYEDAVRAAASESVDAAGASLSGDDADAFAAIIEKNDVTLLAASAMPSTTEASTEFSASIDELIYAVDAQGEIDSTAPIYSEDVTAAFESIKAEVSAELENHPNASPYAAALSFSTVLFWILATLVGTVQGGIQALSRSFFGQIIPPERSNEYYGFLDIFGKFSCVIGPALYSLVFTLTGRASYGILSIILLFFAGIIALAAGKKHFKNQPGSSSGEDAVQATEEA